MRLPRSGAVLAGLVCVLASKQKTRQTAGFHVVRPAGRTHLEVEVLYSPGKGKS